MRLPSEGHFAAIEVERAAADGRLRRDDAVFKVFLPPGMDLPAVMRPRRGSYSDGKACGRVIALARKPGAGMEPETKRRTSYFSRR